MKYYIEISLRILIIGIVAMFYTFIPEHLRDFFGDVPCDNPPSCGYNDAYWDWGIRHYIFNWMSFGFVCVSVMSLIIRIVVIAEKN